MSAVERQLNLKKNQLHTSRTQFHFQGANNAVESKETKMCPVSGFGQLLIVIFTILLVFHSVFAHAFTVIFQPKNVTLFMYETITVNYTIIVNQPGEDENFDAIEPYIENPNVATLENNVHLQKSNSSTLMGHFKLKGEFLGETTVTLTPNRSIPTTSTDNRNSNRSGNAAPKASSSANSLKVVVIRKPRTIDRIFTISVAILVSIIYINFGCALDRNELVKNIQRPIGPAIGFTCQFVAMPLISFLVGRLLFPDSAAMQLGMFFTGVSPSGGASNIWTLLLNGNVDLSITMTTISTLAAFGMMPFWLFTLGRVIFSGSNLAVPYLQISSYAVALIVPLTVGYLLASYCKRISGFLVRSLKCFSAVLIVFIVVFAIYTNLYLFQLMSWKIIVAGMCLPYLGYIVAFVIAKLLKQSGPDCLAIAIETSIQNTGIAIFLLRFTLPQPQADLTTVAPVSVAIMTPLPLMLLFFYKRIKHRCSVMNEKARFLNDLREQNGTDNNNFNSKSVRDDSLMPITA